MIRWRATKLVLHEVISLLSGVHAVVRLPHCASEN